MNEYLMVVIVIAVFFAALISLFIIAAVIKGFRAGETMVEIRVLGFFHFRIHLSNVSKSPLHSKNKENRATNNAKQH